MSDYVIRTDHAHEHFYLHIHESGSKAACRERDNATRMPLPVAYLMKAELERQDAGSTEFKRHIEKL